jgi:GTPase SAR1 family protein
MKTNIDLVLRLVNTLQSEGETLIFLGAGSSTEGFQDEESFPDFDTLVDRILIAEGIDDVDDKVREFLNIMRRWERESTLSVRLASYLYGNPGTSHFQLASATMSLFPEMNMAIYLTTNFDDLMFKALLTVAKNAPQRDPRTFSLSRSAIVNDIAQIFRAIPRHTQKGAPVILKLFGDLGSNSPIFHSEDMLFDEFTEDKLALLFDRPAVFIGYGLRDAPILRMLVRSKSQHPVFVVSPVKPICEDIEQISQRVFYWIPKTFSDFVSNLIAILMDKSPTFEKTFADFIQYADASSIFNTRSALKNCVQKASISAHSRYLNRARHGENTHGNINIQPIRRNDTGPDFNLFKNSKTKILAIVGESGSGKSTLLHQFYGEQNTNNEDLFIYYDAQSFQSSGSVSFKLALDFMIEPARLSVILNKISSVLEKRKAKLFILIDALNESVAIDSLSLRYEIESLANETPENIRFVFSCRRVIWDTRMNPSNDLPLKLYFERKIFLLSKFSANETEIAYNSYREVFRLKSGYGSLSDSVKEHIRDPLMLRFVSEAYQNSGLPQFAPAVLVFSRVMDSLRRRYRQTPLIDFIDCLIDQRLAQLKDNNTIDNIYSYKDIRTDTNLALLAQQQLDGQNHRVHPLTLLEDENIITPIDSISTVFKFTYERFYEYLIGQRLHYNIFTLGRTEFIDFVEMNLRQFRDAHYSFYQGFKSAFVTEYIWTKDTDRQYKIAQLARHSDHAISIFGKDILREVIFESHENTFNQLTMSSDDYVTTLALLLELGFESEDIIPHAIRGIFESNVDIRRKSVSCLISHAGNQSYLEKINSMMLDAVRDTSINNQSLAIGLIYFSAVQFSTISNKSIAFKSVRNFLLKALEIVPTRINFNEFSKALANIIELEGAMFFGANYGSEGVLYPWLALRNNIVKHQLAIETLLRVPSINTLKEHLDTILHSSNIYIKSEKEGKGSRLFAYQIEYRIVQWTFIRAWTHDNLAVLNLLDDIVEQGQPFNIDFALGIVEHALFEISSEDHNLVAACRMRMYEWIKQFETRFSEFYLSLDENDPFSFNLVPLAMLARVEARFFTFKSGAIPCLSQWVVDSSLNRQKMALLAANWLSSEFPEKVLTTLEPVVCNQGLEDWIDRVLSEYEKHSPRLLDDFLNKMQFPTRRRIKIRGYETSHGAPRVQYSCESFLAWLFLGSHERLSEFSKVYNMIYNSSSSQSFCLKLFKHFLIY